MLNLLTGKTRGLIMLFKGEYMSKASKKHVNALGKGVLFGVFVVVVFFLGLTVSLFSFEKYIVDASGEIGTSVLGRSVQQSSVVSVSLPKSFPGDFPVYPGSRIVDAWEADTLDIRGTSVVWESEQNGDRVFKYISNRLAGQGWDVETPLEKKQGQILAFENDRDFGEDVCVKGETCRIAGFVSVTENGEPGSTVTVTMGVKVTQ